MTETQKPMKIAYVPITLTIAFTVPEDTKVTDDTLLREAAFEQLGKRPELETPALYDFDFSKVEFEAYDE